MYLDTSSLVAYYLPERKSTIVQQLVSGNKSIQISQLTETEILSAFNKKVRVGEIVKQKSDEAYQLFQDHKKQHLYHIIKLTNAVFKSSQLILRTTTLPLRTLDAIHLGVAHSKNLNLFSFDKIMNEAAKEFDIPIVEI